MNEIRSRVRALIFGVTGIIVAFLVFRIGLDITGSSGGDTFTKFIFDISDFLISPFLGLVDTGTALVTNVLNFDAILAIGVYIVGSIILAQIVTAFIHDNIETILQNVIDGIFKFLEFILFLRIIFELFALTSREVMPGFVNTIFGLTGWTQGVLFGIPFGEGRIDLSSIIILLIVIMLDLFTERIVSRLFEARNKARKLREDGKPRVIKSNHISPIALEEDIAAEVPPDVALAKHPELGIVKEEVKEEKKPEEPVKKEKIEYKEYSDKTSPPEIKLNKPDQEDPDPETEDVKPKAA